MKRIICFVFILLISVLFISHGFSEEYTKTSARAKISSAIKNAKLYQDYLIISGANEYELAKNYQFIDTAKRCLEQDLKDYCYSLIRKEIDGNNFYNSKIPVPNEK